MDAGTGAGAGDPAVDVFTAERARLVGLAYRLTGSLADAEDIVQETWLRWQLADRTSIERPAAWLTTVAGRIGLDRLRARQRDRAEYVGPWLPEPWVIAGDEADPARAVELSDSLTTAFLLLLEQLDPVERLVVLLADVFDQPFSAVADVVGRSEAACRQTAVRARRKIRSRDLDRAGGAASSDEVRRVAGGFAAAALRGDLPAMMELLDPDVVLVSDGGRERHAARRPVVGADRVARFVVNIVKRFPRRAVFEQVWANGAPAVIVRLDGAPVALQALHITGGRVVRVETIVNPQKLAVLDRSRQLDIV